MGDKVAGEMKTILFTFAGRRANMEIQIPFVRRLLEQNPNLEWHVWNLTHTDEDYEYVKAIEGERITVINSLHQGKMSYRRFNDVWRHYTSQKYRNHHFVKMDDDIVFIETDGFKSYLETVRTTPGAIVSATVVNNGACLDVLPPDYRTECFDPLGIPLLDVHLNAEFAYITHVKFLDDWRSTIGGTGTITTTEWLSINMIGFDWGMANGMADQIGRRCVAPIAGRDFTGTRIGDEGAANLFTRVIDRSCVVSHLTFGPQELTDETWQDLRDDYAVLGRQYLGGER